MKRRILALISVIMSVIIGVACLSGCNLVTKDLEKDMNQTVATVNINVKDEIHKKDLVIQYLNVGYIYVQYYGYTAEKTFNLILNNLIENRILIQAAMKEFEEDQNYVKDTNYAEYTADRYLDDEASVNAIYNTRKAINDLLDSYEKQNDETEVQDTIIGDVRTVPTNASNKDDEVTLEGKREYNEKAFDVSSSDKRRSAFDSVIELFDANGLLGSKYDGKIENTEYYISTLKSYKESEILSKYEDNITKEAMSKVDFAKLEEAYSNKLEEQKAWSNSDFVTGLNDATASSPLLYSAYGKYGYVYNLLLGASDEQTEDIGEIATNNPNITSAMYAKERRKILAKTTVSDLRSSWILSDYYGKLVDGKFVFDNNSGYSFAKDSANSFAFQGDVVKIKDATGDEKAKYTVVDVYENTLDEFLTIVENYLYNDKDSEQSSNIVAYEDLGDSVYKAYSTPNVTEYTAKINDLLFAYSSDDGSLNTYKGYDIAPAVDGSDSEEYVATFGEAGRILLEQGGNGYVVVASDYGYHVMFFSEVIDVNYNYASLTDYLNAVMGLGDKTRDGWADYYNAQLEDYEEFAKSNSYLYLLASSLIEKEESTLKTQKETVIINKYRYEEANLIEVFDDRFNDLFE